MLEDNLCRNSPMSRASYIAINASEEYMWQCLMVGDIMMSGIQYIYLTNFVMFLNYS